jgi:hypothetical protein
MQRVTFYVLLLLVCGPVAAEPINKPTKTVAVLPSPKSVETAPNGPANRFFGAVARYTSSACRACDWIICERLPRRRCIPPNKRP